MRTTVGLVIVALAISGAFSTALAGGDNGPRAELGDRRLGLRDVSKYHCHDGDYPLIRCFSSENARDSDVGLKSGDVTGSDGALASAATSTTLFYVTFFEHAGYGGNSFTTSQSIPNLGAFGWNDRISSFKSLSGQRPKWWQHVDYGGTSWQWPAGAWVSNVGAPNDTFSSVKNVP
jgi:hypothetical protein